MSNLVSFDEAIAHARNLGGKCHLLLGNGFSIGAHSQFQYGTLYEQARVADLPDHVVELFDRYGTANFEEVLRYLDEGQWLAAHYRLAPTDDERDMAADYIRLKESLVGAISASHPPYPEAVGRERLEACYAFLDAFDDVYTINYDLLLYWTSLIHQPFRFEDGFGREVDTDDACCVFLPTGSPSAHLYFLHGALHFSAASGEVQKLVWNTTGVRLIDQVRAGLEAKRYPLIVSEGEAKRKLERIEASSYLSWCLRKFENVRGSLFTYGWAMNSQDAHLVDAIAKNASLELLFVGVYGAPDAETSQSLMRTARKLANRREAILTSGRTGRRKMRRPLEVHFYDSGSANVWGRP